MSNVKQTPEEKQKKIENIQMEKKFGHATVLSGIFEQIMSPAMDANKLSEYMNRLKEHVGPGNSLQMSKTPGIYTDMHRNSVAWYLRTEDRGKEGTDLMFVARIKSEFGKIKPVVLQMNKEGIVEISNDLVKVNMVFDHPEESEWRLIERKSLGDSIVIGSSLRDRTFDSGQLTDLRHF